MRSLQGTIDMQNEEIQDLKIAVQALSNLLGEKTDDSEGQELQEEIKKLEEEFNDERINARMRRGKIKCPVCSDIFPIDDPEVWDGEVHLPCQTTLNIISK